MEIKLDKYECLDTDFYKQMRLINASELEEQGYCLVKTEDIKQQSEVHTVELSSIPTAYDIDLVVERIKHNIEMPQSLDFSNIVDADIALSSVRLTGITSEYKKHLVNFETKEAPKKKEKSRNKGKAL